MAAAKGKNAIVNDAAEATGQTVETVKAENGVAPALKFTVKKRLSENQIKLKIGSPVYVKIESLLYEGKKLEDKKDPATLVDVIDLETGQNAIMVIPAVVQSTLEESYPNGGYVGLQFAIEKLDKTSPDKKYFPYSVQEIEVETE